MTDPIERLRRHNPVDADRVRSAVPPRERQLLLEEIMSDENTTRRRHRGWLVPAAAAAAVAVIAVGVWAVTQTPETTAVPAAGPPVADESSQAPTSSETLGGTPSLGPAEPEMEVEDPCPAYEPTTVSVPQVARGKQLIVDAPGWTGVDDEGAERWTGPGGEVYVTSTGGDPRGNDKYCTRFTGETRIAGVKALSGAVPAEGFVFAVTPPIGESSAAAGPSILIESTTLNADEFAAVLKSLKWVDAAEFDRVVKR